ncbi:MAG: non-hydrolyzing UDP-N-acetylglucosamine 2-epimerase [Acidobacteriaceae bacterium]
MKILSVVGARPQFVKAAVLLKAFDEYNHAAHSPIEHHLLHTGQHHDAGLSDIFFEQLQLPQPDVSLGIGSGKHGIQTAAMMASIEACLESWRPDLMVVYGDTNSTLAGALAASKMHIPIAHLEAGLRSFDRSMPEEINRIISDHIGDLLLCPTLTAMDNLQHEGLGSRSAMVGDVMLDAVHLYGARLENSTLRRLGVRPKSFALVTLHRAGNTDDPARLKEFVELLKRLPLDAVVPMHPRLERCLGPCVCQELQQHRHIHLIPPVGYFEMLTLERDARLILTDSGGVQKEAYFVGVPCLTLREETEWVETVHDGWNRVVGLDVERILGIVASLNAGNGATPGKPRNLASFGNGYAGHASVAAIMKFGAEKL